MGRGDHPDTRYVLPADLVFYASPPHECSYISGRQAVTLFADPYATITPALYSVLAGYGFRRSGDYVYRPRCPGCNACLSARIPVRRFQPNRSQLRNLRANNDLTAQTVPVLYNEEHYQLYRRYIQNRHQGGGMDVDDPERYLEFLGSRWADTEFVEFRHGHQLLAVAVVDRLQDGLSAVYTFFDPAAAQRGLGTYAVLWQVAEAQRRALEYVYLGYWIAESPKMAYKAQYRPLELYTEGVWQRYLA